MVEEDNTSIEINITVDDLERLGRWLKQQNCGATLDDLTRRVIRGRLRYGRDTSPSAAITEGEQQRILSWNQEDEWAVGSRVQVAKNTRLPDSQEYMLMSYFGTIVKIDTYFHIRINDKTILYRRSNDPQERQKFYDNTRNSIQAHEQELQGQAEETSQNKRVELETLHHGAEYASQLLNALSHDQRFFFFKNEWYLQECLPPVPRDLLEQLYHKLGKTELVFTLEQLQVQEPELPPGEMGQAALHQALIKHPDLFQPVDGGWKRVPPPPPPWNKAVGVYYVYDPRTYEILLKPGEKPSKKTCDRLKELGFYDQVVEAES